MSEADSAIRPASSSPGAVVGMSCAILSVIAFLYAAEITFLVQPRFIEVWKSVNVEVNWPASYILDYGVWMLGLVAVGIILSCVHAWRQGGRPRIVALNVTVLAASLVLAWLIRDAQLQPIRDLLRASPFFE